MKHKNSLRLLILTLIGMIMYSCQKEDDFEKENLTSQTTEQEQIESPDKIIGLGEKIRKSLYCFYNETSLSKFESKDE